MEQETISELVIEQQKLSNLKITEKNIEENGTHRDLQHIKCTNIHVMEFLEVEEKENGEKIFEENMAPNSLNFMKNINLQKNLNELQLRFLKKRFTPILPVVNKRCARPVH